LAGPAGRGGMTDGIETTRQKTIGLPGSTGLDGDE
jgi:hypothetical protein